MTLDILICSLNKGIVRIDDLLLPQRKDVRYIVSYQYTDERYLELIPSSLASRIDVVVSTTKGKVYPLIEITHLSWPRQI